MKNIYSRQGTKWNQYPQIAYTRIVALSTHILVEDQYRTPLRIVPQVDKPPWHLNLTEQPFNALHYLRCLFWAHINWPRTALLTSYHSIYLIGQWQAGGCTLILKPLLVFKIFNIAKENICLKFKETTRCEIHGKPLYYNKKMMAKLLFVNEVVSML